MRGVRAAAMVMPSPPQWLPPVHRVVGARGMACPGPLLEAKRGILQVPVGGVMELISSNEETIIDVPACAGR